MPEAPERTRRPRRYFDWRQAARLMAAGETPAMAAAAIGVSEERLLRHFETSGHFLRLVLRAGEARRHLALALQGGGAAGHEPG